MKRNPKSTFGAYTKPLKYTVGDVVEFGAGGFGIITEVSNPQGGWPVSYATEKIKGMPDSKDKKRAWHGKKDFKRLVAESAIRSLKRETEPAPISDFAMIDWLEKQGNVLGWNVQLPSDYPYVKGCVFICRNTTGGYRTLREAIAEKMKKEQKSNA